MLVVHELRKGICQKTGVVDYLVVKYLHMPRQTTMIAAITEVLVGRMMQRGNQVG